MGTESTKSPVAAEHGERGVHLVWPEPNPRPRQNVRVFFEYFGRETGGSKPLIECPDQQSFIPRS
jgi:hypothetical protein